jgi:cytochrome P450
VLEETAGAVFASDVMQNIREKMKATDDDSEEKTFIRALMDPKNRLTEREIRDEIILIMTAAQETTPATTSAALLFIAMSKDVQTKVYAELRQVLGSGENIEYEQLTDLHYLETVINETMRLVPASPVFLKSTDHEVTLSEDYTLPAGAAIFIPPINVHRNRAIWGADSEEFRPERFEEKEPLPYSFIPFIKGPRMCISRRYAMMSMKLTLATFLMRYKVNTSLKQSEIEREMDIAAGKRRGMMSIEERD